MSEQEKMQVAKEYIDKQIATMKTHGCAPSNLSDREYQSMIKQAAKSIIRYGGGSEYHPFIKGLLDKLPTPETPWPKEARKKWLQTAINIFDLMYTTAENDTTELAITNAVQKNSAN
jgi:hypothetical protein